MTAAPHPRPGGAGPLSTFMDKAVLIDSSRPQSRHASSSHGSPSSWKDALHASSHMRQGQHLALIALTVR